MEQRVQFLAENLCLALAETLSDIPEHCIAIHALRTNRCRALLMGDVASPQAAVIDPFLTEGELIGWGSDPGAIADAAMQMPNWKYLEVSSSMAHSVQRALERRLRRPVDRVQDVYHTLAVPAPAIEHPAVRLLAGEADAELYAETAKAFNDDPEDARRNVLEGPVAAAIVDGRVVGSVEANVRTARYANMCAELLSTHQKLGLGTACAALAAKAVQDMGLIPVWSVAHNNAASLRVAEKIGYREVGYWVYLLRA